MTGPSLSPQPSCIDLELGFMALGALAGVFPQPVVDAPASSISPHPGLLSFGSPQAEVPLSGAGGVLLLQTDADFPVIGVGRFGSRGAGPPWEFLSHKFTFL